MFLTAIQYQHKQFSYTQTTSDKSTVNKTKRKNICIVQINNINNKNMEIKQPLHNTYHHSTINNIQETKHFKLHTHSHNWKFRRRANHLHHEKFTDLNIPTNINTHNTELQMIRINTNIHKDITASNLYILQRDADHLTTQH